jgi:hypothetical protein
MQTSTDLKTLNNTDSSNSATNDASTSSDNTVNTEETMGTQLVALTTNNTLLTFDPNNPGETETFSLQNIGGNLVGIDTSSSDDTIYGLASNDQIYAIDLDGFGSGNIADNITLTETEQSLLDGSQLYLTIRTEDFPNGELQGLLVPGESDDIVAYDLPISESQEVGADVPDTEAMGSFDVYYEDDINLLSISGNFSDLTSDLFPVGPMEDVEGNPQTSVHLHQGTANENGSIIRNFNVAEDGTFTGTFSLTEEEELLLLNDQLYVNLHTENFQGGELRGQVDVELEDDILNRVVLADASQEGSTDGAQGAVTLAFDDSTNQLLLLGEFSGLSSPLLPSDSDGSGTGQSAVQIVQGVPGDNSQIISDVQFSSNLAQPVTTLAEDIPSDSISGVDFDPVTGLLRLVDTFNQNYRVNIDTGEVFLDEELSFAENNGTDDVETSVTGSAYSNAFSGATSTQLYNIEQLQDLLVLQDPANEGTLETVGELGVDFGDLGGFDIVASSESDNAAYAISGSTLYAIDLNTGQASGIGTIGQDINGQFLSLTSVPGTTMPGTGDGGDGGDGGNGGNGGDGGNGTTQMLNFEMVNGQTLSAGTVITSQYASQGITISTSDPDGVMIFDTDNPTGGDTGLGINRGNALIISEAGDSANPNAADAGGTLSFDFDDLVGINEVGLVSGDAGCYSSVSFFGESGNLLETLQIISLDDGDYYQLGVDVDQVSRMDVTFTGDGAVTGLSYETSDMTSGMADMTLV